MLPFILGLVYLVACVACGYLGRRTRVGANGTALLAFVFSPLVVFLAILIFARLVPADPPNSAA